MALLCHTVQTAKLYRVKITKLQSLTLKSRSRTSTIRLKFDGKLSLDNSQTHRKNNIPELIYTGTIEKELNSEFNLEKNEGQRHL